MSVYLAACPCCFRAPTTHFSDGQKIGEDPEMCRCLTPRCPLLGKIFTIKDWNASGQTAPPVSKRRITNPNMVIQLDSECGVRHERILIACAELDAAGKKVRDRIEWHKTELRHRIIKAGFCPGKFREWVEDRTEDGLPDYEQFSTVELIVLRGTMREVPEDKKHLEKVIQILRTRGIGSLPA